MQKNHVIMLAISLAMILSFSNCNDFIYDDLSDCPQGVNFQFYRQTPCEQSPYYPSDIKQVRVFAFAQNGILVEEFSAGNIVLSSDYLLETPFYKIGTFTFVAWGGDDLSGYNFSAFEQGRTTKQEMIVSLKRAASQATNKPKQLYVGESGPLTIEDRTNLGSIFDLVSFNMQELTNRLNFKIQGLSVNDEYKITLTDNNSKYDFNGDFVADNRFEYITDVRKEGDVLRADYITMKLAEGRDTWFTITNTTTGKVVYDVNLVDDLLLYKGQFGEPPYNLACDHDFNIIIVFAPDEDNPETYVLWQVIVNDWNVVKREVIFP